MSKIGVKRKQRTHKAKKLRAVARSARRRGQGSRAVAVAIQEPADVALLPDDETLRTALRRAGGRAFTGHVVDLGDLTQRAVLQVLIDGCPTQIICANEYDHLLAKDGIGDGCYGFSFTVPADVLADCAVVEVVVANTNIAVGAPIAVALPYDPPRAAKSVRWLGGLRFRGWMDVPVDSQSHVRAMVNGAAVAEARLQSWHHLGANLADARAVPAFDVTLPEKFADGCVRFVSFFDETGSELPGGPLPFVAFADGLERTLARLGAAEGERLRGELFDRLVPNALPLNDYKRWAERFSEPDDYQADRTVAVGVVFAGDGDNETSARSLEQQTHERWVAAALPSTGFDFDPLQLKKFIDEEGADCDVFVFALSGCRLEPDAIGRLVAACTAHPDCIGAYGDLAIAGDDGQLWPIALPAFDYERMLEQGYGAYLFAVPRAALSRVLAVRPTNLYRLFNALAGDPADAPAGLLHIPRVLASLPSIDRDVAGAALTNATQAHLRQRGVTSAVLASPGSLFPSVRVARAADQTSVSLIIPTRNRVELLKRCIETITPAATRRNAEILIVDNNSTDPETLAYLAAAERNGIRVIRVPGPFNFSKLNNIAARAASGDYLCLINNDIEARDDTWLDEMLSRANESDVGAVGATLLWPSGVIQHAGVVLGPHLGAAHAFNDRLQEDFGYADMLSVARECSSVTGACLLTRKADYLAVGGMDELHFAVNFNDVDYCLKLRALGKRIVVTPFARLLHLESASRGGTESADRAARLQRELAMLRARWLDVLVNDPYYSPMLSLDSIPFSGLAWPPRSMAPRVNAAPLPNIVPSGI